LSIFVFIADSDSRIAFNSVSCRAVVRHCEHVPSSDITTNAHDDAEP
jgi:hypothetical protein